MKLKELRISQSLTQTECANYLGVSLRTYQNYENDLVLLLCTNISLYNRFLARKSPLWVYYTIIPQDMP